jgi:hypothetical protein
MIRLGNSAVTKIEGAVMFTVSDQRFKSEIKEDITGLEFIKQLRPVSYFMDNEALDRFSGLSEETISQINAMREKPVRQIGFIAQDVEKIIQKGYVFSGVRPPQNEKDHYSLAYAEFVVPLVKAVQELNAQVEEQQKTIDALMTKLNLPDDPSQSVRQRNCFKTLQILFPQKLKSECPFQTTQQERT